MLKPKWNTKVALRDLILEVLSFEEHGLNSARLQLSALLEVSDRKVLHATSHWHTNSTEVFERVELTLTGALSLAADACSSCIDKIEILGRVYASDISLKSFLETLRDLKRIIQAPTFSKDLTGVLALSDFSRSAITILNGSVNNGLAHGVWVKAKESLEEQKLSLKALLKTPNVKEELLREATRFVLSTSRVNDVIANSPQCSAWIKELETSRENLRVELLNSSICVLVTLPHHTNFDWKGSLMLEAWAESHQDFYCLPLAIFEYLNDTRTRFEPENVIFLSEKPPSAHLEALKAFYNPSNKGGLSFHEAYNAALAV